MIGKHPTRSYSLLALSKLVPSIFLFLLLSITAPLVLGQNNAVGEDDQALVKQTIIGLDTTTYRSPFEPVRVFNKRRKCRMLCVF
jgi:hypothetical protein